MAAQALGLPLLSPYLQSIGSDYKHGANYATMASTVLLPNTSLFVTGVSPFSLSIQLNQMRQFKTQVDQQVDQQGIKYTDSLVPTILFLYTQKEYFFNSIGLYLFLLIVLQE